MKAAAAADGDIEHHSDSVASTPTIGSDNPVTATQRDTDEGSKAIQHHVTSPEDAGAAESSILSINGNAASAAAATADITNDNANVTSAASANTGNTMATDADAGAAESSILSINGNAAAAAADVTNANEIQPQPHQPLRNKSRSQ